VKEPAQLDPGAAAYTVLVAGRIIKRDGKLLHHDGASVLAALAESADRLTA
jgi:hypothetical protein